VPCIPENLQEKCFIFDRRYPKRLDADFLGAGFLGKSFRRVLFFAGAATLYRVVIGFNTALGWPAGLGLLNRL
jgi:hypothetical protein